MMWEGKKLGYVRMTSRIFYPNWLSLSFFTQGWKFFFINEIYNLFVFFSIAFFWKIFVSGFSLVGLLFNFGLIIILRRYVAGGICTSEKRLHNKTVVITGANAGIGRETARDMLSRGAHVILACRSLKKAEDARRELYRTGGRVEIRQLDLSSLESVREFAEGIKKDNIKIHILINNAGVMMCPYTETSEGFELQMGTNHVGHFLLTNLLLSQLKHGEPARIINVSSLGHLAGEIQFDDFFHKINYIPDQIYANTKLANVLFTRQLAKILKGSNIQVFSLHPGAVHSELSRHLVNDFVNNYVVPLFSKSTAEGAQTSIYCALEAEQHPDMYFSDCCVGWVLPAGKDDALAEKLWNYSAELVKLDK